MHQPQIYAITCGSRLQTKDSRLGTLNRAPARVHGEMATTRKPGAPRFAAGVGKVGRMAGATQRRQPRRGYLQDRVAVLRPCLIPVAPFTSFWTTGHCAEGHFTAWPKVRIELLGAKALKSIALPTRVSGPSL